MLLSEMKLLSDQQMDTIKSFYIKFCKKFNLGENELLLKQLENGNFSYSNGNNNNPGNLNGIGLPVPKVPSKKNSIDNKENVSANKEPRKTSSNSESSSSSSKDSEHEDCIQELIDQVKPTKIVECSLETKPTGECKEEAKETSTVRHITPQSLDKENCLICMERTREIVFLPCSHFLTCPLCAPKLTTCPICNKKLEKHLKIYWC